MRRFISAPQALFVMLLMATPVAAADLALKRVMLSSGGVGYFEYEATVEGDATLGLDVALDQVDDVLKSLVVYDETGRAGEITLPGRTPLTQSFADLPFDRTALGSAADLLNALQGAEIRVAGAKPIAGRLVHVNEETVPGGNFPPLRQTRVTVLTDAGLQQFTLQDAESIAFADPELQKKIATALTRLAAYRGEARRHLSLTTRGAGPRRVRVGYVVAMPLWKASYRLSLPADPAAATARLQGWAVLENFSGQAWQDVELTLLSGNPVTFRQALYESYYVTRPTVPVEAGGRVLPPADSGAVATGQPMAKAEARPAPAPMARALGTTGGAIPAAPPPPAQIEAAQAGEDATQIAFTLPYKISAPVGQSLVLPLLDREVPARQIDLYQPAVDRTHPLAAVELTNSGDTGLPPGVLTLYRQDDRGAAYLGDARLAAFPTGDKRLLSYAVDNKATVDRSVADRRFVVKASAAEGVLRVTRLSRQTTTYRVKTAGPAPTLIVEHPRRGGWNLSAPPRDTVEMTAAAYRIPADLAGKSEATIVVSEDQPLEETIALSGIADDRLDALVASSELDPATRRAMTELAGRRRDVGRQRAELERLKDQRGRLVEDESRLRDDLTAVGREAVLRKRLLDKFAETVTAIDAAAAAIAKASAALAAAESELATYIARLSL